MTNPQPEAPKLIVPRYIEYFEAGVFSMCTIYGLVTLVNYGQLAPTAAKLYPGPGGVIFLALLFIGGLTGLSSYAMKTIMGLKVELASLTLLVTLCVAYSLWTPFSAGTRGVGLLLWMGILIAIPGYLTRRRLAKMIKSLESMITSAQAGEREAEESDTTGDTGGDPGNGGRR